MTLLHKIIYYNSFGQVSPVHLETLLLVFQSYRSSEEYSSGIFILLLCIHTKHIVLYSTSPHSHCYSLCTNPELRSRHLRRINTSLRHWRILSTLLPLCSPGICAQCDSSSVHMHHKFAVVDNRLLITGSLNWTRTAVQSNMENILVTEEPDLVQPFVKEFQRLWVHRSSPIPPAHQAVK